MLDVFSSASSCLADHISSVLRPPILQVGLRHYVFWLSVHLCVHMCLYAPGLRLPLTRLSSTSSLLL